jgi:hypothetical protein
MRDPHQDVTAAESPLIQKGLRRATFLSDCICSDLHDLLGVHGQWCAGNSATCVGTLPEHTKRKSAGWLTHVSSPADLSCPFWARAEGGLLGPTRTLLVERPSEPAEFSNLQPSTRVRVTDTGVSRVGCWPLLCLAHPDAGVLPSGASKDLHDLPFGSRLRPSVQCSSPSESSLTRPSIVCQRMSTRPKKLESRPGLRHSVGSREGRRYTKVQCLFGHLGESFDPATVGALGRV